MFWLSSEGRSRDWTASVCCLLPFALRELAALGLFATAPSAETQKGHGQQRLAP
jgi:hypothetical protein